MADIMSDVKLSPDFGLAVLGRCAPEILYWPWYSEEEKVDRAPFTFCLLPFLLFFAQWGLLVAVFTQSIRDFENNKFEFCFNKSFPNDDDQNNYTTTRTVMFFICILYIKNSFESTANFWNVFSRSKKKRTYMTKRGLSRLSSSLAYFCYIDCCSELLMDSFCLMVNLWMVYGASKPIDMILNSLAIQFINSIDNEFCNFFIEEYPFVVKVIERHIREKNDRATKWGVLTSPDRNLYGKLCTFPLYFGSLFYSGAIECISALREADVGGNFLLSFLYHLLIHVPLASVIYVVAICFMLFGIVFACLWFVPAWILLFSFKPILATLCKISEIITNTTPYIICAFLIFSPICKPIVAESDGKK